MISKVILSLMEQEPYSFKHETYEVTKNKIVKILKHPYFKPFDENVNDFEAREMLRVLWNYYHYKDADFSIDDGILSNKGRPDKDINKDIKTIKNFLDLLQKNYVYSHAIEQNYVNKSDDRFVYDYCINLMNDLDNGEFKKSLLYSIPKHKPTKSSIENYLNYLREKFQEIKAYEIENLRNLI